MKSIKIKTVKIIVWVLMLICLVFNSIPTDYFLGTIPHIVAGSLFTFLSILHIILSRKYFIACLKNFFTRKLKMKARVNIIIDFLLIGLLIAITITGVQASPSSLNGSVDEGMELVHGMIAASIVILGIVHGCLHIRVRRNKQTRVQLNKKDVAGGCENDGQKA